MSQLKKPVVKFLHSYVNCIQLADQFGYVVPKSIFQKTLVIGNVIIQRHKCRPSPPALISRAEKSPYIAALDAEAVNILPAARPAGRQLEFFFKFFSCSAARKCPLVHNIFFRYVSKFVAASSVAKKIVSYFDAESHIRLFIVMDRERHILGLKS